MCAFCPWSSPVSPAVLIGPSAAPVLVLTRRSIGRLAPWLDQIVWSKVSEYCVALLTISKGHQEA